MSKIKKCGIYIAIFGFLIYVGVYIYASHSEAFKFVKESLTASHEIEKEIGSIERIYIDPFGGYSENSVYHEQSIDDTKSVKVVVDIVGSNGKMVTTVTANKLKNVWKIDQVIVDNQPFPL